VIHEFANICIVILCGQYPKYCQITIGFSNPDDQSPALENSQTIP